MSTTRKLLAAALTALLAWSPFVLAQDKPKAPDDLEKLLEKIESKVVPQDKGKDDKKPAETDKDKDKEKPKGDTKPRAKDKDLDDLLEKIGRTTEAPTTSGKAKSSEVPDPTKAIDPDQPKKRDLLPDEAKKLDLRLEEILGRKRKKQGEEDQQDQGMLAETIKKMREVEQRLEEPDTGEQTRKKQDEIVKDLEQVLKQVRQQAQAKKKMAQRKGQMKGQQPGDQPGEEAGQGPRGAEKPNTESILAKDKNPWGHLPPTLREEMANIFKEGYLQAKADLIKRYYLSVNKKALTRGE